MVNKTVQDGLFKPELWSKELNRKTMDSGVMVDLVNRKWEGEIKNVGDTVNIQTVGDMTVNNYDPDTDLTYQDLDGDTQKLIIDQKKYWGFRVDDIDKVQANIEFMGKYTDQAKKQLVNEKDAFLLGKSVDVPSAHQLGDTALTPANSYAKLIDLFVLLAEANAIDNNGKDGTGKNPWLVVDPKTFGIFKQAPEAIHATQAGDTTIRKGTLLQLAGFDIKTSTVLKAVEGKTTILAGTTEAITFAEQITKVESMRSEKSFKDLVRGLYVYGAKTVNPHCLASMVVTSA